MRSALRLGGGASALEVDMAWLLRRGEVLASVQLVQSRGALMKELGGRDHFDGALLAKRCKSTHSMGLRIATDVAYLDDELTVLAMTRLARFRVALPKRGAVSVLQAEAGAFERWNLHLGDVLELKD